MLLAAELKKWNRRDSIKITWVSIVVSLLLYENFSVWHFTPCFFVLLNLQSTEKQNSEYKGKPLPLALKEARKIRDKSDPHPVVRGVDYAFNWINNLYLANTAQRFVDTYPLDSDLYIALSSFQTTDLSPLPLPKRRESTKTTSSPLSLSLKIK